MNAAVAEVGVRQAVESILGEERVELAQVCAEARRRHGGILERRPRLVSPGRAARDAGAVLAQPPDVLGLGAVEDADSGGRGIRCHTGRAIPRVAWQHVSDLDE